VHLYEAQLPVANTEGSKAFYLNVVGLHFAHRILSASGNGRGDNRRYRGAAGGGREKADGRCPRNSNRAIFNEHNLNVHMF
jgi:predicted enzyme related to lactoylglutathione lyase